MGGLFGKNFDWGEAALGLFADPRIMAQRSKRRQDDQKDAKDEVRAKAAYAAAIKYGMSHEQALTIAADQDSSAALVGDRSKFWDTPATGGNRFDPLTQTYRTAPRADADGNIYAPGDGTKVPEIFQRGTKTIPVTAGGEVRVVDSIGGSELNESEVYRRSGVANAPQIGAAPVGPIDAAQAQTPEAKLRAMAADAIRQGRDPAQVNQMLEQLLRGGAAPSNGPPTFPRPY